MATLGVAEAQASTYWLTDLGTLLGATSSYATGINASGQVVGVADISGNATFHAFISAPNGGVLTDLNSLIAPSDPLRGLFTLAPGQSDQVGDWITPLLGTYATRPGSRFVPAFLQSAAIDNHVTSIEGNSIQVASLAGHESLAFAGTLAAEASPVSGFQVLEVPLGVELLTFDWMVGAGGDCDWMTFYFGDMQFKGAFSPAPVPIPPALGLFVAGLAAIAARRRKSDCLTARN